MSTQIEYAKKGIVTKEMEIVGKDEFFDTQELIKLVAQGRVVIPANINHKNLHPIGIGEGLRTKINANIGTSGDFKSVEDELAKLETAIKYKADTVMDLSTGGDISYIRRELIKASTITFGNVPIYQMMKEYQETGRKIIELSVENIFRYIEEQANDGVDYMTIHAGLTMEAVERMKKEGRTADIVSRGGSIITAWMLHNEKQNPFYENFDRLLEICKKYDVTLSLGDGLRPGCLADGTDRAQIQELIVLGELVQRSREADVQAMVEGPGHMPMDQIETNIKIQKELCNGAPFYVLGPIVTDIAPGYDHITSAIGGAIAAGAGADFLCYVTPAEHLGLPDNQDVKEGIMASRIAAHAADIKKKVKFAGKQDKLMGEARKNLDWEAQENLSMDKEKFRDYRERKKSSSEACSMCGELCVYTVLKDYLY